jgi:uncharacterized protein (TIGR03086 family)
VELLDAHGQAMSVFDRATHAIADDQWDAPTPCAGWSVRDLLGHLVVEQLWVPPLLDGATIEEVGDRFDGDQLGADPIGRWTEAARQARRAWTAPGALDRRVHLSFGTTMATEYGWQMTLDLAVHGWDMAVAVGRPDGLGDQLAEALLDRFEDEVPRWSGAGIFDPPVPVPADAPPQTRLVALLGRKPVTV